jgi:threonine dehydrogenase-like Zn-dependent dehydrogenase
MCTHPHQDRFNILEAVGLVHAVPDDVSSRQAIFASMFCVALNASKDGPVRAGDDVVVSGLGQIGTFCAFLSRKNAGRLILIDPDARRRERVGWIGADAVIAPEEASASIAELTENRGADLYIEASGAPAALQQAVDNTGTDGTIVPVAWYGTREVTLRLSPEFHLRRQRIISSQVVATVAGKHPGWDGARAMSAAMRYLGEIDPAHLISHEVPFERAPEAYQLIDKPETPTLGVLLVHQTEAPS